MAQFEIYNSEKYEIRESRLYIYIHYIYIIYYIIYYIYRIKNQSLFTLGLVGAISQITFRFTSRVVIGYHISFQMRSRNNVLGSLFF